MIRKRNFIREIGEGSITPGVYYSRADVSTPKHLMPKLASCDIICDDFNVGHAGDDHYIVS